MAEIKKSEKATKIDLLEKIILVGENERGRIARELQDNICSMLSAAKMGFATVRLDGSEMIEALTYREAMRILDEIGNKIRELSHDLMPEVLFKQSLPDAVHAYCSSLQKDNLKVECQSYGIFDILQQDFKLNVYRIIQELLKNIAQHAQASKVFVQLSINEHDITITVEDNGIGFDTNNIKSGIGLQNIRSRVRNLDGHFTIESELGKGTTAYIQFETLETT